MNTLIEFLFTALITAVSLIILSYIPFLGISIDSLWKAIVAGIVFGLLNAFVRPVLAVIGFPFTLITLGLFRFIINAIIFGLAAWLVSGFRLRNGFVSALLGAIALSIINSLLFQVLGSLGLVPNAALLDLWRWS